MTFSLLFLQGKGRVNGQPGGLAVSLVGKGREHGNSFVHQEVTQVGFHEILILLYLETEAQFHIYDIWPFIFASSVGSCKSDTEVDNCDMGSCSTIIPGK